MEKATDIQTPQASASAAQSPASVAQTPAPAAQTSAAVITQNDQATAKPAEAPAKPEPRRVKISSFPCGIMPGDECLLCDGKFVDWGFLEKDSSRVTKDGTPEKSQTYAEGAATWFGVKHAKFNQFKDHTNDGIGYEDTYCWKPIKSNDLPSMKEKGYQIMESGDVYSCKVTDTAQCLQPSVSCKKNAGESKFACSLDLHVYRSTDGKCPNSPQGDCARFLK